MRIGGVAAGLWLAVSAPAVAAGPAGQEVHPVTMRLYSDFICPFCYIAEHSTVPRLVKEYDVTVDWRGFQLHPDTPVGGMKVSELFQGRDVKAMHERLRGFALSFGVSLPNPPAHLPNTRKALAVAEYARDHGKLDAFREAAMKAYWQEGRDLEAPATLEAAAKAAGLDPQAAEAAASSTVYQARVDGMAREAGQAGIEGIPTFVFKGVDPVVGCQPYEALVAAAKAAGAVPRAASKAP